MTLLRECIQAFCLQPCQQRPKSLVASNVVRSITIGFKSMFSLVFTPHPPFRAGRAELPIHLRIHEPTV